MNVRWAPEAIRDRVDIMEYIGVDNPRAALKLDELFDEAVAKLAEFPMLGRRGDLPGTRELFPHESYRLVYRISEDAVWVLALVHTARQWPPIRR